jgi:predicted PurR-regulated permease PerM
MRAAPLPRINSVLLFLVLTCVALYFGRGFLIPFVLAILLAMLVAPVCRKLEKWGIPRGIAGILCVLLILAVAGGIIALMIAPITEFAEDLPQLQSQIEGYITQFRDFLEERFGISQAEQESMLEESSLGLQELGSYVALAAGGLINFLFYTLLVMVYVLLLLYYREKYENFFLKIRGANSETETREIITRINRVSQHYLAGRLIAIVVLAVLYSVGLLIVGVQFAILLGSIAAILTIIPYIGTTIGATLPVLMALITSSSGSAIGATVVVLVVQLVDEYVLEPFVVGGEVSLGPLPTIVSIIVGGLFWGVAGMILFIPLLGVIKVVLDSVPSLRPYGYLIGAEEQNQQEYLAKVKQWFHKKFSR